MHKQKLKPIADYEPHLHRNASKTDVLAELPRDYVDMCFKKRAVTLLNILAICDEPRIYEVPLRTFATYCRLTSREPKSALQNAARTIRDEITRGNLIFFGSKSFSKSDVCQMDALIRKLETGQFEISEPSGEDVRKVRESIISDFSSKDKPINISCEGKEFVDGEVIRFGQDDLDETDSLSLGIPLLSGLNIRVEVVSDRSNVSWIDVQLDDVDFQQFSKTTYPQINPICSSSHLVSSKCGIYVFETRYPAAGTLELPKNLRTVTIPKNVREQVYRLQPKQSKIIKSVIRELGDGSREDLLRRIHEHLICKSSGERTEEDYGEDIDDLLTRLSANGSYPGDCKAISTMSVAFANALGFPARRICGFLSHEGGHTWAEIYAFAPRTWAPFDPAAGAFLHYPKSPAYNLISELPADIVPFDIRVTYF